MMRLSEICRRAQTGPAMAADTFDRDVVFAGASRLCEEYGIVYDENCPVPSDDDLVDRTFQADVDLYGHIKEGTRKWGFVSSVR
jgi:methylamine---corrinoid protein Co-methyltransferase